MHFVKRLSSSSMFVVLLSSQIGAAVVVNEGILRLENFATNSLYIGPNAQLDLYSNSSWGYVTISPFNQIWDYAASGFNGGTWDGPGLLSGWAKDHPLENGRLAIVSGEDYIDYIGESYFHGHEVHRTDTLIQYTVYGDSNLDGVADEMDANYVAYAEEVRGTPAEVPNNWIWGNYNYCAVPEPSSIALLLVGVMSVLCFVYKKKIK